MKVSDANKEKKKQICYERKIKMYQMKRELETYKMFFEKIS